MHERDERWAYVVLALLVIAYLAYRFWSESGTGSLGAVSVQLPHVDLSKLGRSVPYLAAPLFAVVSEIIRRRKARAIREAWELNSRVEGFVRGEDDLKVRFAEGGRGTLQSDVRMTRSALYLLDRTARREPMRFAFSASRPNEPVVLDAALLDGRSPELRRLRVFVGESMEGQRFAIEFESQEGEAWLSSIRHAMGRGIRQTSTSDGRTDA